MKLRPIVLLATLTALVVTSALVAGVAEPDEALAADPDPCAADGLNNAGFEDGALGGDPSCWSVSTRTDRVQVVGTEGPGDFPTYADEDVTVTPPLGQAMLALGSPKRQAESQTSLPDTVAQTFVATSDSLQLQLRVFSWEHKDVDQVRVSIDGGAEVALSLEDTPKWTSGSCGSGVCEFTIDTGRRSQKNLLDTDWRVASFTGLTAGTQYTVEFAIGGTDNSSFPTWGYVDNVNSPPVARFDIDRPEDCTFSSGGPFYEGQPIPLSDCSYDPDGEVISREWTITFPEPDPGAENGLSQAVTDEPTGFIIPADQGDYTIELTVTDDGGLTDTVVVAGGADDCTLPGDDSPQTPESPGAIASDGTCLPAIRVLDAPPLVDAVDVQAVAGSPVELVARYSDAGVLDDHVVTVDGDVLARCTSAVDAPCFDEDNLPAVETGIVLRATTAPGLDEDPISIPVTVRDPATGAETTDTATITAIEANPQLFETPLNSIADARTITAGSRSADWIDRPGDIDLFKVEWPGSGGQELPAGTELLVSLRDLPADLDVAVLVRRAGETLPGQILPGQILPGQILPGQILPGQILPGQILPGQITPGQILPGQILPGQILPGQILPGQILPGQILPGQILPGQILPGQILQLFRTPGQILPGQILPGQILPGQILPGQILSSVYDLVDPATAAGLDPYTVNPFQLYPLSLRAYTGTNGTNLTGTDVDLDELGLGQIADGLRVAAYSANRGLVDDNALVRIDEPGSEVYIAVVGANGEFSNVEPYALQVEASAPFDSLALAAGRTDLFGGACERDARGGTSTSLTGFIEGADGDGSDTLFVTSWDRLESSTDDPEARGIAGERIEALRQRVGGAILDLGGSAFTDWDNATCDVAAANAVADLARIEVQKELALHDYEHVVVVGGDDIVPFRRVVDETTYSNETQYATSSFLTAGQPIFAGLAGGFNLTDNHLADIVPTPWRGRQLWVPDVPTARLVETEIEIAGQVDAFLDPEVGGQLDLGTAFVTGSEFFDDGSEAVAGALGTTNTLIDDTADAAEYRCALFGDCPAGGSSRAGDVNAVNAHYQHFATFSPKGAAEEPIPTTEVIPTTAVNANLGGSLFLTIGCHAGLAVPDDEAQQIELGAGLDASLDWAQALARQNAVMIANTGYGLGDDAGVGYSELLQLYIAEGLAAAGPGVTVGDVVLAAQQRYLTSVTQFDEYHEKTIVQTTVYGLPFYEITGGSGSTAPAAMTASTTAPDAASFDATASFSSTGDIAVTAGLTEVSDDRGSYYSADGEVLATVDRPKQPVITADVPSVGAPAHGVLIRHDGTDPTGSAGTYGDEEDFDPVIHAPTSEWLAGGLERQVCLDAWWPSTLAQLNTLELGGGELLQTVSIKPGQFRCTSGTVEPVTGTQRLFDGLPLQLLRSDSDDWQAPVIRQVDFEGGDTEGSLDVTMVLDDASELEVDQIVVLRLFEGVVTSEDKTFGVADDLKTVTFTLDALRDDEGFLIQLADAAGNVTTYTGKSTVPSYIEIDATGPDYYLPGESVTLTATIPDYAAKVTSGELVEPVWYSWEFGAPVVYQGRTVDRISSLVTGDDPDISIGPDAVISVAVTYDDTAPYLVVATARVVDSDGGVGVDRHEMRRLCDAADLPELPDADLVTCGLDFDALTPAGDAGLGFTVGVAGVISDEYQYRIGFDTDGNGGVDKTVKYQNGSLSGSLDATVTSVSASELLVTFDLADVATPCPDDPSKQCVIWIVETQGGIAGGAGQGFLDRMLNDLTVTEVPT